MAFPEIAVFLQAELEPVQVRAPEQAAHDHPAGGRLGQHPRHLRARAVEPLVRVAAPVGEQQQVARVAWRGLPASSSAKYAAPCSSGRTRFPAVQAAPSG